MVHARWRAEAEARLPAEMPAALVFAFGINDCAQIDGLSCPLITEPQIS